MLVLWGTGSPIDKLSQLAKRVSSPIGPWLLVSSTFTVTQKSQFNLPLMIYSGSSSLLVSALLDSVSDGNFIDRDYCLKNHFPSVPLDTPLGAFAPNGHLLARITHQTQPLEIVISSNHREKSTLIFAQFSTLILLGFPWVHLHNPHVVWQKEN